MNRLKLKEKFNFVFLNASKNEKISFSRICIFVCKRFLFL